MGSCRCKMCGGHIHYETGASVATCEFCGTEQTIVKTDDVKKVNLFNRANTLRLENEFDKAQLTYDNILIDDPNNAEAHWGICLCRYGIQYVDTKDGKKVPMCHRTAIRSIFDDLDYKETINNADVVAKVVYEKEANAIDKIQKGILAISQKEEPYDVFISYKGHDENNNRTKDSYKAEEIYNALTKKNYRVFFSRVTLKNKDVSEYEPIIFAALMSSKVLLSIGSKIEHYNSIWEKNEWFRFLSFMKDDHTKYLIPCYFDMDKSNLPMEFMSLQSQNIDDGVKYVDELLERIDKIFSRREKLSKEQVVEKEIIAKQVSAKISIDNYLGRMKLFLNDGEFERVYSSSEQVLNTDYKNALAYYYRLLAFYGCKTIDELAKKRIKLDNDSNYQKAVMFADSDLKKELTDLNQKINDEIDEFEKNKLLNEINYCIKKNDYNKGISLLSGLDKFKDGNISKGEILESCYKDALALIDLKSFDEAISILSLIKDYKDSEYQISEAFRLKEIMQEINNCNKL